VPGVTRYVVLLRGINVGRAKRVGMGPLRELLTARGHRDVRTLLQSGNVVLSSDLDAEAVAADVHAAVAEGFGHDVAVVVRTAAELAVVVAAGPLLEDPAVLDPARYLVTFLAGTPDPALAAAVPAAGPDEGGWWLRGRELHLWLPGGVLDTPVGRWRWDRLLGVAGTARNWTTVQRVAALTPG
jgi:uncharacterized protein (DUF1697 family)